MRLNFSLSVSVLLMVLSGCAGLKPLKPGKARFQSATQAGGAVLETSQPENPQHASTQDYERTKTTETTLPAGSVLQEIPHAPNQTNATWKSIVLAAESRQRVVETEKHRASIGAAQKDNGREISAKLAHTKWIQVFGMVLLLACAATFHPVVKAFVQSKTVTIALGVLGLVCLFAPFIVIGSEKYFGFLAIGGLAGLGLYFFGQRNARHKTEATVLREIFIDKNNNGIDDRKEANPS